MKIANTSSKLDVLFFILVLQTKALLTNGMLLSLTCCDFDPNGQIEKNVTFVELRNEGYGFSLCTSSFFNHNDKF